MTKVSYKMIEHDGRYYFNDGTGYFLIDTGFNNHSVSRNGAIGPYSTSRNLPGESQFVSQLLDSFMGPARPEGQKVKGILAPMEGYSVLLKGDTVTIDDKAKELPEHAYFIPFLSEELPIIEGKCNGKTMRFFFDSGMRMAVLDDSVLTEGKPCLGTIKEWVAPLHCMADAQYYSAEYEFADGLRFEGHGEYDYSQSFVEDMRRHFNYEYDAFFGIEFFKQYDLFISVIPGRRGLALIARDGNGNKRKDASRVKQNTDAPKTQAVEQQEAQLKRICQDSNPLRRKAVEGELASRNIDYKVLSEGTLVVPARSNEKQGTIALCAHYDVVHGSKGYNDNGMSIVIALGMLDALPDNVEVVFTNGEECGQTGAREYLHEMKDNLKACIVLDVCGCFDAVYLDPKNCMEAKSLQECKKGRMPYCDADVFEMNGVPTACFSTGPAKAEFRAGIMQIMSTLHNNYRDNDFSLLNFDMVPKVQAKVLELIGLINK